mgnify:CR=1 FL=1
MPFEDSVIREFFAWVDSNHDGFITIEEIKTACEVDINGDGTVSEDERLQCARGWLAIFANQDIDSNQLLSLQELLDYNAKTA